MRLSVFKRALPFCAPVFKNLVLRLELIRTGRGPVEMFVLNSLDPVLSETVAVITE